jgi:glycosyltransferase involved in cell wall biosynthesis
LEKFKLRLRYVVRAQNGMKVSVIIPTYYRPKDLSELFESLLKQTVKPLEVIVVDDTPSNIIEEVCENFQNMFEKLSIKLAYVRNYKERSAAIARNIGASIARGEIILFLDSDIILYPDYIEKILEVFREKPEALGVQGWIDLAIETRGHIYLRKHHLINNLRKFFSLSHLKHSEIEKCKLFEYPARLTNVVSCEALAGSNMAFKREVFNHLKFDENLKSYSYMEDKLFTHSVYKKYPDSLYITPYAKCIHKVSREGRTETSLFESPHKRKCRKYVLMKLFGVKGLLIFFWQTAGLLLLSTMRKVRRYIRR